MSFQPHTTALSKKHGGYKVCDLIGKDKKNCVTNVYAKAFWQ
jgi:hypothetical protein